MGRKLYKYKGETHTCAEWAALWGVKYDTAYSRLITLSLHRKADVSRRGVA